MKQTTALLFIFLLCVTQVYAKIEDGIAFDSYNVPAEERTSLSIYESQNSWVSFSDSLTVSFSVKINFRVGRFGYICRMFTDNYQPMDIILSPIDNKPVICATADHRNIVQVFEQDTETYQWRDVYLRVHAQNDSLFFTANGKEVLKTENHQRLHKVRIVFGKVDIPGFVTSDVAPMILADLRVRKDSKKEASWMLSEPADLKPHRGIDIKAVNPNFCQELNIYWKKILSVDVPSVTYSCFSPDKSKIYLISEGQILVFDVHSQSLIRKNVSTDIKNAFMLDMFEVLPDGNLICADAPNGEFIKFNIGKGGWEKPSTRTRTSTTLHHNTVYLNNSYYQMFGYGQHQYSNTAWIWNPDTFETRTMEISGASPRYLAGAGEFDGKIYVLGGKGNETGQQELGVKLYNSLLEIEPQSLCAKPLWSSSALSSNTVARDIIFLEDGLYALLYNPEIHDSSLRLTRFNIENGEYEYLATPIPYPFLDITSEARLAFNQTMENFVAAVCYQDANSVNKADVYVLSYPVLPLPLKQSDSKRPWWIFILISSLIVAIITATIILRRKFHKKDDFNISDIPQEPQIPLKPGVYFLDGFHVRNRDGIDIASSFSPTLFQFFAILVLYSAKKGGVSNARLKSILWPDKSDESFNNNKGVYLRKLRDTLKQVGSISIVQEGGLWKIEEGTELFDYIVATRKLENGDRTQILRVASWGPLLPEYQYDWLDSFKAEYTDHIISSLTSIVESGISPETALRIADCRLLFDTLDEDAILEKCQALITLGRAGTAKAVFERFTADYQRVMGEDFDKDFPSFVKKTSH